jgi:hypothetical protein
MANSKVLRIAPVILAICLTALLTCTLDTYSHSALVSTDSTGYVGIWQGWTTQHQPETQFVTVLNLVPGDSSTIIGTTAYPKFACGGVLTLIESTAEHLLLSETLTYGWSRCYDQGIITLTVQPSDTFDYAWHSLEVTTVATSTLERIGQGGEQIGDEFIGIWAGKAIQQNFNISKTIQVALAEGVQNTVVGSIAYPSLHCGGELTLQMATAFQLSLSEVITFGSCSNGKISLTMQSDGTLLYEWQSADNTVTGTLRRISNIRRLFLPVITK